MSGVEHVVSFSGGKDSTALYLLALERGRPFKPVFADTGNEHESVYEMVEALPRLTGGPAIETVTANFDERIANKRVVVETKWRREGVSEGTIATALDALVPSGNPFLDLCIWKGRFPSTKARFCTEELKVYPIQRGVYERAFAGGKAVVSWQGVRAEESFSRSLLPRWQRLKGNGRLYAYRPLLAWKLADVWAMHAKHGIARNRLYNMGMGRVGCMPCIMARKDEMREIAARFPEHVARIAQWESVVSSASKRECATFFAVTDDPNYEEGETLDHLTHGIYQRVEWSKTSRGGKQYDLALAADFGTACNQWGACE